MQITDSTFGNRSLALAHNEVLDSAQIAHALLYTGQYSEQEATEMAARVFDALETLEMDRRVPVAA